MTRIENILPASLGFALFLVFGFLASPVAADPGKKVYDDHNCNVCHSVDALDMKMAGSEEDDEKDDVSDLSNIGSKYDRRFLARYLVKQEKIDGKEHPTRFRGERDELAALATWLESLKHGN